MANSARDVGLGSPTYDAGEEMVINVSVQKSHGVVDRSAFLACRRIFH